MHEQYVNTFIIFDVLHAGSYNLLVGDIPFLWLLILQYHFNCFELLHIIYVSCSSYYCIYMEVRCKSCINKFYAKLYASYKLVGCL